MKKITTMKKFASTALALTMVGGCALPIAAATSTFVHPAVSQAWAADDEEATTATPTALHITTPTTANKAAVSGTEYTVIKIFGVETVNGDWDGENAPTAIKIDYATGVNSDVIAGGATVKTTNEDDEEVEVPLTFANAQYAAEYINDQIDHKPGVLNSLEGGSYGIELAKRLIAANGTQTFTITADDEDENGIAQFTELDGKGYYLVVRTADLTDTNSAASEPVFALLDEGNTTITLKTAIPSIVKEVQEDSAIDDNTANYGWGNGFGEEADHTLNQDVNYRLAATLPENLDAYSKFKMTFNDAWNGDLMTVDEGSVKVYVDGEEITLPEGAIAVEPDADDATDGKQSTLTVDIEDIKAAVEGITAADFEFSADSVIEVFYTAQQTSTSANPEGVENKATLTYSNNPAVDSSFGETNEVSVKDYSYALKLHKTDKNTGEDLNGVEFTIVNESGKYIGIEDGKLVETDAEYVWTTDDFGEGDDAEKGIIYIDGIDASDYVINEKTPLDNYDKITEDINVSIDATTNRAKAVSTVKTDTELAYASTKEITGLAGLVEVENVKQIALPSTGAAGLGILLAIAAAAAVKATISRRKEEKAKVMVLK